MSRKKWGLAMLIACPSCAVGFTLVVAALFGVTAAAVKGSLLGIGASILAYFWIRNAWRRRGEDACSLPESSEESGAQDLGPRHAAISGFVDGIVERRQVQDVGVPRVDRHE